MIPRSEPQSNADTESDREILAKLGAGDGGSNEPEVCVGIPVNSIGGCGCEKDGYGFPMAGAGC